MRRRRRHADGDERLALTIASPTVLAGQTTVATVRDATGAAVDPASVTWRSDVEDQVVFAAVQQALHESIVSLPSIEYRCAAFNPISEATAVDGGDPPIIPASFTLSSAGFLRVSNCRTSAGPLTGRRFIFAFHAQGVGPYGTVAAAKYTKLVPEDD